MAKRRNQEEAVAKTADAAKVDAASGSMTDAPDADAQEGSAPGGMTRRAFGLGVGGACALLAMGALRIVPAEAQVRPPGGQDEDQLLSSCIRCERCVEICPKHALRPAHVENGVLTVRMPTANFDEGWCDYCQETHDGVPQCVATCPTHALKLPADATPENVILGKAKLIKDWCLAWDKVNGCRFCYDACPYEAIELDANNRPVLKLENCNGCGACQSVCVSQKEGSITAGATSRAIIVVPESSADLDA